MRVYVCDGAHLPQEPVPVDEHNSQAPELGPGDRIVANRAVLDVPAHTCRHAGMPACLPPVAHAKRVCLVQTEGVARSPHAPMQLAPIIEV